MSREISKRATTTKGCKMAAANWAAALLCAATLLLASGRAINCDDQPQAAATTTTTTTIKPTIEAIGNLSAAATPAPNATQETYSQRPMPAANATTDSNLISYDRRHEFAATTDAPQLPSSGSSTTAASTSTAAPATASPAAPASTEASGAAKRTPADGPLVGVSTGELSVGLSPSAAADEESMASSASSESVAAAVSPSLPAAEDEHEILGGGGDDAAESSAPPASFVDGPLLSGDSAVVARRGRASQQVQYTPPASSRLSPYSPSFSNALQNSRAPHKSSAGAQQQQAPAPSSAAEQMIGAVPLQFPAATRAPLRPQTPFDPIIVCYLGSWSVYRPSLAKFTPENINPFLCTHVIYAFAGLSSKLELKPFDSYNDITQGGYRKFTSLKEHNKQLKTLIAVGGWNEGSAR